MNITITQVSQSVVPRISSYFGLGKGFFMRKYYFFIFILKFAFSSFRYMSQETYDQLKDQRDVRIKHIEEYIDWQYKEEHEIEQERRRRKKQSTETTPIVEKSSSGVNTSTDYTTKLSTTRPRMVEKFTERKFTLPFETTVTEATQDIAKEKISTTVSSNVTSEREDLIWKDQTISNRNQETQHHTSSIVSSERSSTLFINQTISSSLPTQSKFSENTLYNTLVQQLMEYKRINLNHLTKQSKVKRFTISDRNYTKTKTPSTKSTDYLDYIDYNISTTENIIHGAHQHEDPLEHLTNIPPQVFDAMKLEEDDLYQRYHNHHIDFNKFKDLRDKLVSKYIVYAKSTTPYRFPTFNITASVFPTIGKLENYADVQRAWKKVVAYEKEMATANDSFLQSAFSLALTNFPPTVPPNKRRRYRRMAKNSSPKRKKEPVLKNSSSPPIPTTYKRSLKFLPKNRRRQGATSTLSEEIVSDTTFATSKRSKAKTFTDAPILKKEIKSIQKQLCILKKDLEKLKADIRRTTNTKVEEQNSENEESLCFIDTQVINNSTTPNHSAYGFERKPFLYAKLEKNGE